MLTKEQ